MFEEYSYQLSNSQKQLVIKELLNSFKSYHESGYSKILIAFTGIPGTGKTTISKYLQKKYGFQYISSDFIKNHLIQSKLNFIKTDIFDIQSQLFQILMETGKPLVSDSNSALQNHRDNLIKLSQRSSYKIIFFYLQSSPLVCLRRILAREDLKDKTSYLAWKEKLEFYSSELEPPKGAFNINTDISLDQTLFCIDEILKKNL